jgi:hypothetical protein
MTVPHLSFSIVGTDGAGPVILFFLDFQHEVVCARYREGLEAPGSWMPYQRVGMNECYSRNLHLKYPKQATGARSTWVAWSSKDRREVNRQQKR